MNKNNNPYPKHSHHVKNGDEIEFMSQEYKQNAFQPMTIRGIVTKVLENSVIVDMSKDSNYKKYYDYDHTVINHRKYTITALNVDLK